MEEILDIRESADLIKDNSLRSKTIYYIMLATVFLNMIYFFSNFLQYQLLEKSLAGESITQEAATMNNLRQQIFAIVILALLVVNIIFLILWFRRAYNNLHLIGAPALRFSEGWAAGAWFVPFLNLGRPYVIMKEICENTVYYVRKINPEFASSSPEKLLGWWWALYIMDIILDRIAATELSHAGTNLLLLNGTIFNMIAIAVSILTKIMCIVIVRKMFVFEKEMYDKQGEIHAFIHPFPTLVPPAVAP
jgi:hypothetical protein